MDLLCLEFLDIWIFACDVCMYIQQGSIRLPSNFRKMDTRKMPKVA